MKYLKKLSLFLLISLLFFSCVEHDKNSHQKVNAITGVFTRKQVESGSLLYTNNCGACHGKDLRGSEGGNALIGERFITKWNYIAFMGSSRIGPYGLPLVKPPYGRITAIDLNTGNHKWMVPNGDTPDWIKNIPALKDIDIPRTGLLDRVGMLVTKTLLFAGEGAGLYASDGGGGKKFRSYEKTTGKIISEIELPANQCGIPMTYSYIN